MNNVRHLSIHTPIKCPTCDGNYLHQYRIVSRIRDTGEDCDATVVIHDKDHVNTVRYPDKDLPHRRDSLDIYFWCEHCHAKENVLVPQVSVAEMFIFRIYQHKGHTFMEWVRTGNEE